MSGISAYFLVYGIIHLGMLVHLCLSWRNHIRAWQRGQRLWRQIIQLLGTLFLLLASGILAFMIYFNWASWRIALDPDTPAPFFEVFWIIAVFVYGISMGLAGSARKFLG